jgi:hypothetical protein
MLSSLAACGGGGDAPPADAPAAKDVGFNKPTKSLKANMEVSEDSWMEIGPADLTCLNTPSADLATTVEVAQHGRPRLQSDNPCRGDITAFGTRTSRPVRHPDADGNAALTITIPVGTRGSATRWPTARRSIRCC